MNDRPVRSIALVLVMGMLMFPTRLAAEQLRVFTKQGAVATHAGTLTIGDVATVSGGTPTERRRVSELDLDTLGPTAAGCRIARRNIELRILVDGFPQDSFTIGGPQEVLVRCATGVELKSELEQRLADEITRQFGLADGAVAVRLMNADQVRMVESKLGLQPFTTTVLLPTRLPIGKPLIEVEFEREEGPRLLERFETHVIVSMQIAVANQRISRGTVVAAEMVSLIKRPLQRLDDFADPTQIVGKVAKRDIARNQVVLNSYVGAPPNNRRPVINRNDLLDVIVRVGRNEVRLKNAKALSSGDVGDTIAILNTQSKKQFKATVVSQDVAMVSTTLGLRR